ncbi:4-(cytidine 5'-diphospho)-2-C-methyl-D-erythritol kinase [Blastopirellula sp. JC732]|uniref:4-diphosphocytidyl-2-C-methyl-D-erythritol kinase n=1 Tax=Blastopirellula sediminis TaxID=2894196 RepID=A0A9X1MN57_9BACT|nr:4-(cytidine 5'-diphospho)-2-C-methyl-D-erythritol kinase [Blastopirellula sediminis]MCC9606414.1 4-(cytidine 5'-diphospho)-2-C-methyl-D-erythritol kinase [Blastopirellula sediminis]MCC9630288.1 4-(cytidine 5'-diphospho)-2-C-methyl-D-erythritol kinase [Blastopirellula sediminis]
MFLKRSADSITVHSPAKLNLFLELLAKRPDGFHELETIMTAIDVFDTLRFTATDDSQLTLSCRFAPGTEAAAQGEDADALLGDLPTGPTNLVYRAVDLVRRTAGIEQGAKIELIKRIPAASGLGGASSDAAAALVAADIVWKLGWSRTKLSELAAQLGSDVPFFLHTGLFGNGMALCRGRGEIITPLPVTRRMHFVVVRPPGGLSTADVFRRCTIPANPFAASDLCDTLQSGTMTDIGRRMHNRLSEPSRELSTEIDRLTKSMLQAGAISSQMSGSGSACFALCQDPRHARRVAAKLKSQRLGVVFTASNCGVQWN